MLLEGCSDYGDFMSRMMQKGCDGRRKLEIGIVWLKFCRAGHTRQLLRHSDTLNNWLQGANIVRSLSCYRRLKTLLRCRFVAALAKWLETDEGPVPGLISATSFTVISEELHFYMQKNIANKKRLKQIGAKNEALVKDGVHWSKTDSILV